MAIPAEKTCNRCDQRKPAGEFPVQRRPGGTYLAQPCKACARERRAGTYNAWRAMRERCHNPNHQSHPANGARGTKVCQRWDLFANFLADMGERPPGHALRRIDWDGDYEPANCHWQRYRAVK